MKLGYACINESLGKQGRFKTIQVRSAKTLPHKELQAKIKKLTLHNLETIFRILKWNVNNNISVYRLPSNIVPLDNHELNDFDFESDKDVIKWCNNIKGFANKNDIRLSMHPDQFCVLSSHNPSVVLNSVKILEHHNKICNLVGAKTIILHVGSTNGGKITSMSRFMDAFKLLDKDIQDKIVLENDDKSYNIDETLELCQGLDIPMCIDVHHHNCNNDGQNLIKFIRENSDVIENTWNNRGMIPKIHLSTGRTSRVDRAHSDYISDTDFDYCLAISSIMDIDIMFECKKKELSVLQMMEKYGMMSV